MKDYREITAIGQNHRQFIDTRTGDLVKCLCPCMIPFERDSLGFSKRPEVSVKNCPIHGW